MPVLCIIIVYVTSCVDCTYTVCACAVIELSHSSRARTVLVAHELLIAATAVTLIMPVQGTQCNRKVSGS